MCRDCIWSRTKTRRKNVVAWKFMCQDFNCGVTNQRKFGWNISVMGLMVVQLGMNEMEEIAWKYFEGV